MNDVAALVATQEALIAKRGPYKREQMPKQLSKARLYDLAAASPLIVFYTFAVAGFVLQIHREISGHPYSTQLAFSIGAKITGAIFAGTQVVLFIVRKLPLAKSRNWWPRIIAAIGANSAFLFLILPGVIPIAFINNLSSALIIGGTAGSIFVLSHLGRSFSVTPQARALVVNGPYRFVRHPLYLSEQIITFGIMLQYKQPWAFLVFAVSLASQFPRMHYEEQVLSETFPAYRTYSKGTARLIPGIY
jgi:protein-S-isoprenylcysteine O-methyltransferase Ste14